LLVAQEPAKPPAQEEPLKADIVVVTNFVVAPVIARDARGNIVNGLTPLDSSCTTTVNCKRLRRTRRRTQCHGRGGPIQRKHGKAASRHPQDREPVQRTGAGRVGELAVLSFDHRVQTMTEFTTNADKISAAFMNIKSGSAPTI